MMVLLSTTITAIATPLISVLYDPTRPYRVNKRRTIQHTPPNAELHIVSGILDQASVSSLITLLEISNPTPSSPFSVYALRLIELVGRASSVFIDHENQEMAFELNSYNPIHNALRLFEAHRNEYVKIHPFTSVSPKRTMYQDICDLALMKKATLIILPFHDGKLGGRRPEWNSTDAREALAYADRIAGNPDVSLTVIRFLCQDSELDDVMEKKLDDGVVTWFWVKNEGNERVIYREVVVRNGQETVAAIQAMNDNYYDLWIVGRKQGINPVLIEGLSVWSENNELGVIGDYVASVDLSGKASVLVVQQQPKLRSALNRALFLSNYSENFWFWTSFGYYSAMDDDISNSLRRMSSRTRKVAPKMVAALASSDNRTQAALARLEALESDNVGIEMIETNDDDDASLDDDDQAYQKRQSKSTKRKTRQAKALENAKKAPRTFLELLHEANVESLPPHVPFLSESSSGASKLHLPPPFLHCLWIHFQLYMCKVTCSYCNIIPCGTYLQKKNMEKVTCGMKSIKRLRIR
ncbi:hypothetical protein F0562_021556 [Nyssa sinensis]|uniref:Cation/H(+) antiporter C-terminal domain-containing protein n=1 Tax=Nyssa sinensis TaxID=561372 RepID=A0A5J5BLX0_9ASTE|nr:hypothetical protein F0562_021556 [Nyssa sinensis]